MKTIRNAVDDGARAGGGLLLAGIPSRGPAQKIVYYPSAHSAAAVYYPSNPVNYQLHYYRVYEWYWSPTFGWYLQDRWVSYWAPTYYTYSRPVSAPTVTSTYAPE